MLPKNGFHVQTDGTAYNPVVAAANAGCSNSLTTEEFIPFEFAKAKLNNVVSNYQSKAHEFTVYIQKLQSDYREHLIQSKKHYEGIIHDLKGKAKKHVELLKTMREDSENKLRAEISSQHNSIEDLRDMLATSKNDAREAIKKEGELKAQVDLLKYEHSVYIQCQNCIGGIISQIEVNRVKEDDYGQIKSNFVPLVESIKKDLLQEQQRCKELETALKDAEDELDDLNDQLEEEGNITHTNTMININYNLIST